MPKSPAGPRSRVAAAAPAEPETRADYIKVGITLPPETYKLMYDEIGRRKMAKAPDAGASAIIREALDIYLGGGGARKGR